MPSQDLTTRRGFLSLAATTAAAARPAFAAAPGAPQIGILLATFNTGTLEARLDAAKACGLACTQINMTCAGLSEMPDEMPAGLPERIRRESAARGLAVASLQGTFNMCHPDPAHRSAGLRRLRVLAEACAGMGAPIIHICTGTRNTASMWRRHPDNNLPESWRDMAACVREATEIARQFKIVLAFEPEVNNIVDSSRKARRLIDEIGSPHLKLTMDPANIFHTGDLPRMSEILDEAFELVGKDTVLAHAKDLDRDGDAGHLPAGHGRLDYGRYMRLLVRYGFKGPLLLHGLTPEQVPGCVAFVREKLAAAIGASA